MREFYHNGDPIELKHNGCDGCSPNTVNGVFVHEKGCPDAWRDNEGRGGHPDFDDDELWPGEDGFYDDHEEDKEEND